MAIDTELQRHKEWLGYVQPVGLVVSPPALSAAQAFPNKNIIPDHARFLECVAEVEITGRDDPTPTVADLPRLCTEVLGWRPNDLVGSPESSPLPDSLEVALPEYNETLRPSYALREDEPGPDGQRPWMMLIQSLATGAKLDDVGEADDHRWQASPQARFERLLRETQVPIGLLANGTQLRLVYAPRGETSGHVTFNVKDMTEVAGRPIFAALHMLLCEERLFSLGKKERLPAILSDSRKYQNLVSTQLAEQVLEALYELVRGFQSADDRSNGELLRDVLADDPNHVYAGLLTVLMRLVFVLYAEDRGLVSSDEVYQKYYAVAGLFERLREDAGRHTDTMDHRYGAWAQLLTLFRLVHDGGRHGGLKLLARKGYLFDPDRYPFLEGRTKGSKREAGARCNPPHVPDGVVFRVLHNLLILGGERLSYRTLDVEQIGSVYETMMGFNLEVAKGRSIAIKPKKAHGAPTTINLDELLAKKTGERAKWLKEQTDQDVTGQAATALKGAESPEDAVAALEKKVAKAATPRIVPPGAMVLQPSDERRKSGSHYTPRALTEPIVRMTFRPILERLGESPKPEQILDLKVCDPAMGSGAFLVEASRQLGDELVKAWHAHDCIPTIPPDEDELLHARRIVAQRCLYGVDKNPMAVDLAKLSLWLGTLAKEHAFTFLDHALRFGDSLVGLSKAQILGFHWKPEKQRDFARAAIEGQLNRAMEQRRQIREAPDGTSDALLREKLQAADGFLDQGRRYGDLVISAFFAGDNDRKRKERIESLAADLAAQRSQFDAERHNRLDDATEELHWGASRLVPFHWEIEFPEVFDRENPGFDAFVGNPPFLGGARISTSYGEAYFSYLTNQYPPAGHQCDLVGYFFRRAFDLLRVSRCLGLIATNTISQGDTRQGSLSHILRSGGVVYDAIRRYPWPGQAAVIVSRLNIAKGFSPGRINLNGKPATSISAYLMPGIMNDAPAELADVPYYSKGSQIYGQGFLFDDDDLKSSPIEIMNSVLATSPECADRIFPYIGGEELNTQPVPHPERFAIYFSDILAEEELSKWPPLEAIVRERVKPERDALGSNSNNIPLKRRWWAYQAHRPELYAAAKRRTRMLACSQVTSHLSFAFLPPTWIYSQKLCVFDIEDYRRFAVMQSRCHDYWSWFLCSTMKDDLNYSSSDCFATFPFPASVQENERLESTGRVYYEFRSALMVRNNEGLTKTYNRFHAPEERSPDILRLRDLHAAMDKAALEAYGWTDLAETAICEFLLDYEEDEDDEESTTSRRRKKPWRCRWPDDFRDEVLARLLELNRQRAEQERLAGLSAQATAKKPAGRAKGTKKAAPGMLDLFESRESTE